MAYLPRSSVWRVRLVAFALLFALWPLVAPHLLRSQEAATPSPAPVAAATPSAPGPYTLVNRSYGRGRSVVVGLVRQSLDDAVRVRVLDAANHPVSGVRVEFDIASRPKGAGDAIIIPEAVSGPDGMAVTSLKLGSGAGDYTINAWTEQLAGDMVHVGVMSLARSWWVFLAFGLIGGISLFLFGMELATGGLQKAVGSKMRDLLGALTTNRFTGILVGAGTTAIVHSNAITVMLVSFVSAALMTLPQALGVIMGANIGTTLAVQIIAFQISDYAMLMIGVGFVMTVVTKHKIYVYIGEVILGFGLIFYGLHIMSGASGPLRAMPAFSDAMHYVGNRPILGIIFAALFTGIIQSSGATISILIVLAAEGLIDLRISVPIILGAQIGTCATALLASLGSTRSGKRVALGHLTFNIASAIVIYLLLRWYVPVVIDITHFMGSSSVPREIANAHTMSALLMSCLFFPLVEPWGRFLKWLLPDRPEKVKSAYAPQYLDNVLLETPDLALTSAYHEVTRLAGIVSDMLARIVDAFGSNGDAVRGELSDRWEGVEHLTDEMRRYYIRLSQKNLGLMQSREKQGQMSIVDDLRQIAQNCGTNVVESSKSLADAGAHFSAQGTSELAEYLAFSESVHSETIAAMVERDASKARAVRKRKDEGEDYERRLRESHLARLDAGLAETVATSTAHMDLLSGMRQIGRHDFRICHALADMLAKPA